MPAMFDSILKQVAQTDFDFRQIAHPDDPAKQRFDEWVDYYKLKAAIAKVVQPQSILEIGVRFGYSAAAFLHGNPAASYVGIDNDSDSFGGTKGAIEWARQMLREKKATFLVADSQGMKRFPGGVYDLIHVDGQQDGDGTYHDLELAIKQGRVVLVDGYFWTAANFHAVNEFLFRHKEAIEWFGAIPGYAGELLIKVKPAALESGAVSSVEKAADSQPLRDAYTASYYLRDCGGWNSFQQHQGRRIADCRLGCLISTAMWKSPKRLLDLGCGRGELVYAAASRGVKVTAVDYSSDAIQIAKSVFAGGEPCATNVEWICDSAVSEQIRGTYDAVIASDLIEHMSPAEVDHLYAKVASQLSPQGLVVIHTRPNRWHYQYDHARRRRIAASVGAYLPRDPRSHYEKLMHINEQSPRVLLRQLRQRFKHVLLWFGTWNDPAGSLGRRFGRRELAAAPDLYAMASHEPIATAEVAALLTTRPIPAKEASKVWIEVLACPASVARGSHFDINVKVVNGSGMPLGSFPPFPVCIAYHWVDAKSGRMVVSEGLRAFMAPTLRQHATDTYNALVLAPPQAGEFKLEVRVVQEWVRWFDESERVSGRDCVITVK